MCRLEAELQTVSVTLQGKATEVVMRRQSIKIVTFMALLLKLKFIFVHVRVCILLTFWSYFHRTFPLTLDIGCGKSHIAEHLYKVAFNGCS